MYAPSWPYISSSSRTLYHPIVKDLIQLNGDVNSLERWEFIGVIILLTPLVLSIFAFIWSFIRAAFESNHKDRWPSTTPSRPPEESKPGSRAPSEAEPGYDLREYIEELKKRRGGTVKKSA